MSSLTGKSKIALYWASSCGGCEIAVLGIHEKVLDVADAFDIVFWPCVLDGKREDVDSLADGELLFTLFNGAIRNDENYEMAQLLRRKSQVLVAFGSCAHEGCMPGLGNFRQNRPNGLVCNRSWTISNIWPVTRRTWARRPCKPSSSVGRRPAAEAAKPATRQVNAERW